MHDGRCQKKKKVNSRSVTFQVTTGVHYSSTGVKCILSQRYESSFVICHRLSVLLPL